MFGYTGYEEIIGAAMDELDALDASAGAYPAVGFPGAFPAVGLKQLIGAEPSEADFMRLMASAGADGNGGGNPLAKLAAQMQQARAIDPNAVVVRERAEDTRRTYALGFGSDGDVAAGASAVVRQQPQVTFRPERLVVPSFIAPFFTIDNIIVGKDSQTAVGNNPVSATTYSEVAVGVRLELKTANLGHLISLAYTNIDGTPHRFHASMIGTVVEVG